MEGYKMKIPKITFQRKRYILVDNVITTKESYENGTVSYALLTDDGNIMRYGEIIGNEKDIEFIGEEDCKLGLKTLSGLLGDSWWKR